MRDLVTVTGTCAAINVGSLIECDGNWINDKNYGRQFKANNIRIIPPTTLDGIIKYLGSGLIKGIGPVFAKHWSKDSVKMYLMSLNQRLNDYWSLKGLVKTRCKNHPGLDRTKSRT